MQKIEVVRADYTRLLLRGSITVLQTSSLTGLELNEQVNRKAKVK